MDNKQISQILQEIGDILEIKGTDRFRVNAYHNASRSVLSYPKDLRDLVEEDPRLLEKVPGIGANIGKHVDELVNTGACREFDRIRKLIPHGLLDMLRVRGVGPKKVKLFFSELKIKDIAALEQAAKDGILASLPGMGEKSQKEILEGIAEHSKFDLDRVMISEALMEAEKYIEHMRGCSEVKRIEYAGSLRRRQETCGDVDLLVGAKIVEKVMERFVAYGEVMKVLAHGSTKSAVILESGIQVDLRVVDDEAFGAALHYFTGSKEHNIRVRDIAKKKGLKVSEYGVFKRASNKMIACKTEEDVFKAVGLKYIEPELREGLDEITAAKAKGAKGSLPRLIELKDLKCDLHMHSDWSDGKSSLEEMAENYRDAGLKYIAICDHSSVMGVTQGLNMAKVKKQWKEIDKLNKKMRGFKILKGSEVDILKDGSLDFPDEILKELDIVVIAAHMYGRLPKAQQMKRLIAAIENPYSKILAHPSGRMINRRGPMDIDMVKIIDACKVNNVVIEINSNPLRLDLTDKYVRIAKDKGVKIAINSDGHDKSQHELLKYGIFVARRGWLTKNDVINTYDLDKLLKIWE
jgi:DNA polymerase (family X)